MGSRLADLARDILEDHRCYCFIEDLSRGETCPCGGDGRDDDGDPTWEGCWHCQAREALAEPSPLEVAMKALEEIAKPGLARWAWGWERHGYPDKVIKWIHHCGLKTTVGGDCDNPNCDTVIASRALATIRGGENEIC